MALRSDMSATVRIIVSASTESSHAQKTRNGEMGQELPFLDDRRVGLGME
jgi:hypothetical protein